MNRTISLSAPVIGAVVLAAALAACSEHDDECTAGQALDGAMPDAK